MSVREGNVNLVSGILRCDLETVVKFFFKSVMNNEKTHLRALIDNETVFDSVLH